MVLRKHLLNVWGLLKETMSSFMADKGLKLSAALSYYTVFSLPPLLMIVIAVSGFFFGREAVTGEVYAQLQSLVGAQTALEIQEMIKNVNISQNSLVASITSGVILLITASGVFGEIQDSMNYVWGLKTKPNKGLARMLINRAMSFSMIASIGFLLLVGLVVSALLEILSGRIEYYFHNDYVWFFNLLNNLFVFVIIAMLFAVIFRTLPDGKVSFRDVLLGASVTALFFMIGKFAIGFYMEHSNVASMYGTSASVIIILLWVYYSAIILYFGAEFTKVYSLKYGSKIAPNKYAVFIDKQEIEVRKMPATSVR